jgi:hypothetical protein
MCFFLKVIQTPIPFTLLLLRCNMFVFMYIRYQWNILNTETDGPRSKCISVFDVKGVGLGDIPSAWGFLSASMKVLSLASCSHSLVFFFFSFFFLFLINTPFLFTHFIAFM